MDSRRVEINVEVLTIDDGKRGWLARRGIDDAHVFEVLFNRANPPHYFVRFNAEKNKSEYAMVGRTDEGRYLLVAIEHVDGGIWRVVSGNWLRSRDGAKRYGRE